MKKRAIQYAALFLITGLVLTVLVGYVERKTILLYEEGLPYLKLAETVKNRVIKAQLGMEEIIAGDNNVSFEKDVLPSINGAVSLLKDAYDGKPNELGKFERSDEELRVLIKESLVQIDKVLGSSQTRSKVRTVSADADAVAVAFNLEDKKIGLLFDQAQASVDRLLDKVNDDIASDRDTLKVYSWVSIFSLGSASLLLAFVMFRLQDRNEKVVDQNSTRMQEQAESAKSVSAFIESISAGDFSIELQLKDDNSLSSTLLTMRDKLRENAENDRRRNWSTSGLAQIGEILRANTASTTELYDNILKFVVKYTKSNQGGLFLLNEDQESDKYLELVACYAFERKKYLTKRVTIGEGLVGQCFLEGERIYLLEVPQEYVSITSGLGGSNPNALLIVPLRVNDSIFGVLELATFNEFEEFEIELVEKLAESIASTISSVRINESTRILLEKTQQQAEEMRAQEEEMRQNMEELEATQEEMRRKEKHIQEMLEGEKKRNEFNNQNRQIVLTLSKAPEVLRGEWNNSLETITGAMGRQLQCSRTTIWRYNSGTETLVSEKTYLLDKGTYESDVEIQIGSYPLLIAELKAEKIIRASDVSADKITQGLVAEYFGPLGIQSMAAVPYFSDGKLAGYVAIENQYRQMEFNDDHLEFLQSCADIITVTINTVRINTMIKELSDAQETLQTIIDNLPRAVFWKGLDLRIQGCNRKFASVAGMKSPREMIGKTDFDMPWKEHAELYRADDTAVMVSREARIDIEERNVNSDGVESWVLTSKVPVINHDGEVVAVLGMFEDITERKKKEADVEARLRELEILKKKLGGS
jgi:PAS domain S-box